MNANKTAIISVSLLLIFCLIGQAAGDANFSIDKSRFDQDRQCPLLCNQAITKRSVANLTPSGMTALIKLPNGTLVGAIDNVVATFMNDGKPINAWDIPTITVAGLASNGPLNEILLGDSKSSAIHWLNLSSATMTKIIDLKQLDATRVPGGEVLKNGTLTSIASDSNLQQLFAAILAKNAEYYIFKIGVADPSKSKILSGTNLGGNIQDISMMAFHDGKIGLYDKASGQFRNLDSPSMNLDPEIYNFDEWFAKGLRGSRFQGNNVQLYDSKARLGFFGYDLQDQCGPVAQYTPRQNVAGRYY